MADKTLAAALVAARKAMKAPALSGENPHFHSKFVPRDSALDAIMGPLSDEGVFLTQGIVDGELVTSVHGYGEGMVLGRYPVQPNADPQKYMAACTYASRGSLMLAFALAGDPDDDGNTAAEPARTQAAVQEGHDEVQRVRQQVDGKTISAKQAGYLVKQAESFGYSRADVSKTCVAHYGLMPNDKGSVDLTGLANTQMNELLAKMKAHPKNGKSVPVTDEVPVESLGAGEMPESDEEIPFFARFHRYEGGGWWA